MKKLFLIATALAALVSCTSDDFVGESPTPNSQTDQGAIAFGSGVSTTTRSESVGAEAANKLNNKFIVSGFKGDGSSMSTVFDNYIVNWKTNTAGTTESNSSDWEYVGITAAAPATVTGAQTIKYWDYSTSQYDFAAYSLGTNTPITTGTPGSGEILVTSITKEDTYAGPTYTLKGSAVDLAKCYISDMVTVVKNDYNKVVKLSFRSLATKIRVAFYETIPGYSVKDVQFYVDDATTAISTDISSNTSATLFIPSGTIGFGSAGTYTISFPTIGTTNSTNDDYNKAHVAFSADADATTDELKKAFGTLDYTTAERNETAGNYYLGRSSNDATYAGTSTYYATVLPNPNGAVLELRVNYTLVSVDGTGETITIHGAKAFVPAIYAQWLPNYAYTYIFKISDNTNGWTSTSTSDPAGLYPITFDAVVADSEENTQSTITTVATPSITTYQKGHDIEKDEYDDSGDIYVQVISEGTLKADLASKGQLYTMSALKTEAEVMDALNIQAASDATTVTGRNGLVLTNATSVANFTTIPGEDGNDITVGQGTAAKFTPSAGTNYAYVYDATPDPAPGATAIYTAITLSGKPSDWNTGTDDLYYTDPEGTTAASTTYADGTYYKKYTNQNKVYGVKVIKVEAAPTPTPTPDPEPEP